MLATTRGATQGGKRGTGADWMGSMRRSMALLPRSELPMTSVVVRSYATSFLQNATPRLRNLRINEHQGEEEASNGEDHVYRGAGTLSSPSSECLVNEVPTMKPKIMGITTPFLPNSSGYRLKPTWIKNDATMRMMPSRMPWNRSILKARRAEAEANERAQAASSDAPKHQERDATMTKDPSASTHPSLRHQDPTSSTTTQQVKKQHQIERRRRKWTAGIFAPPANRLLPPVIAAEDIEQPENPRRLNVALVGPANAGKSTLINHFVRRKISATSQKAQTTRKQVLAVHTHQDKQIVFFDTPGVLSKTANKMSLQRSLATAAWNSLSEADHVVLMVDVTKSLGATDKMILNRLKASDIPVTLVLNKIDVMYEKRRVHEIREDYLRLFLNLRHVFLMSATKEVGLSDLKAHLYRLTKPKPWLYPSNVKSVMSDVEMIEEIVREKIFRRLNKEIPYLARIKLQSWVDHFDGTIELHVGLNFDHAKHLALFRHVNILEFIRTNAEEDIRMILDRPIDLHLIPEVKQIGEDEWE